MALTNIKSVSLYNAKGEYINMFTPSDPAVNTAYFIPSVNSWDGLATISVADDVFDTDNTDFRSQLGKIQYAPRIFTIHGIIIVLNPSDNPKATEQDLYEARSELLRNLQKLFSEKDGSLRLAFSHDMNPITFYTLYCHLHGADAFRVIKQPNHYEVTISLIAEDPLIYQEPITETVTDDGINNSGDVEEYAKIELLNCVDVTLYTCILPDFSQRTVKFREPINGDVTIDISYPHQICSISGDTTIDNIDISEGKSAFIKLPRGNSYWRVNNEGATVKITYRQPLLGIAP